MGEAGSLSTQERRDVIATAVRAAAGRVPVIAGVSSGTPAQSIAYASDAAAAGAAAIMLLPPLGYRGDERETVAFYRAVADGIDLPIMLYNNPEASGTDLPAALIARIAAEVDQVVAVKECSGDARRIPAILAAAPQLEVLVGGDDWALEGFASGATGWVSGVADCAPADCVALYEACRAADSRPPARSTRRLLPLSRLDMTPQARPVLQGGAGRARPRRRPGPRAAAGARRRKARDPRGGARPVARAGAGRRLMRAARVLAAVDSHTEGMPTRVITGGVGPIPGASMLERKLHFEARAWTTCGSCSCASRAVTPRCREPSCSRRRGRMRTGACCSSRSRAPADVRPRDHRRRHRAGRDRHGRRSPSPRPSCGSTRPAGLVTARVAVEGGKATAVTLRNVPSFLHATDREVDVPGLGTVRYDMAFGGNFYAITPAADAGLEVDPRALGRAGRGRPGRDRRDRRRRPPVHPADERIAGCAHVVFHAPGRDGADARAATSIHPGWLDRSPCGTGTSARLAQLHGRGQLATGAAFVNESVIGTRFTGRVVEETTVAGRPAIVPEITGRAWITAMGQYLLDPSDPFPAGFDL